MKRVLCICMSLWIVISLLACTGNQKPDNGSTEKNQTSTAPLPTAPETSSVTNSEHGEDTKLPSAPFLWLDAMELTDNEKLQGLFDAFTYNGEPLDCETVSADGIEDDCMLAYETTTDQKGAADYSYRMKFHREYRLKDYFACLTVYANVGGLAMPGGVQIGDDLSFVVNAIGVQWQGDFLPDAENALEMTLQKSEDSGIYVTKDENEGFLTLIFERTKTYVNESRLQCEGKQEIRFQMDKEGKLAAFSLGVGENTIAFNDFS